MTVYCSYCSTGYLLPDHLLGPRGARVKCPRCAKTFVVFRDPAPPVRDGLPAVDPAPGSAIESPPEPSRAGDAASIAREVMTALSARLGSRLTHARATGRVLAEFGPDLMGAYDDYRRRVGADASPTPFKTELRERWGVDLLTGIEG